VVCLGGSADSISVSNFFSLVDEGSLLAGYLVPGWLGLQV